MKDQVEVITFCGPLFPDLLDYIALTLDIAI